MLTDIEKAALAVVHAAFFKARDGRTVHDEHMALTHALSKAEPKTRLEKAAEAFLKDVCTTTITELVAAAEEAEVDRA